MQQKWFKSMLAAVAVAATSVIGQPAFGQVFDPNKCDPLEGYVDNFTVPKDEAILLGSNVKLSQLESISGDLWLFHSNQTKAWLFTCEGPLEAGANKEGVHNYKFVRDDSGEWATCQFEGKWAGAYRMTVMLKLTQVGSDVYGQVCGTAYNWNQPYGTDDDCEGKWGLNSYFTGVDPSQGTGMTRGSLHNVALTFKESVPTHTVRFVGFGGAELSVQSIDDGDQAIAPVAPDVESYVFRGWTDDFSVIRSDMTISAIYHKLSKVTFKDYNGDILKEQIVEEPDGAVAPDMTGKTVGDDEFLGWDVDFSAPMVDIVVTAVYGERPYSPVDSAVCYAGLLQGKLDTANDFTTDFIANSVIPVEVVPGTVMADVKASDGDCTTVGYTNPYTGSTFYWNKSNTTYGYLGQIWLNEGDQLHVAKNIDDSAFVKIDGTEVLKDTSYTSYLVKTYVATFTGWYDFEARAGDGSGGKGPSSGPISPLGLAYNINGATTQSATGWSPFRDTTGTFLRTTKSGVSYLMLGKTAVDNGDMSVELGAQNLSGKGTLIAVYGVADGGENPDGWAHVITLAELSAGSTPATTYKLNGLANHAAVRFILIGEATATAPAFYQATALKSYVQRSPLASVSIGEIGGQHTESAPLLIDCEALGEGMDSVTVRVEVADNAAFENARLVEAGTVSEVGVTEFALNGLVPASDYFVRVVVDNGTASFTSETKVFSTYNPYVAHPGDTLIWNGGTNGTWDDGTKNWMMDFNGHLGAVAWVNGCKAVFPNATEVTVAGAKSVIGFEIGADVTLKGEAITLTAPATVVYNNDGTLRFENDVSSANGMSFDVREQHDEIHKYEIEGNITDVDQLLFSNVRLDDMDSIVGTFHGQFGGASIEHVINSALPNVDNGGKSGDYGLFYFVKGEGEWTCQFQTVTYGTSCLNVLKLRLHQVGDDVWGYRVYKRSLYAQTATYFGTDFDTNGVTSDGYDEWLFNLELRRVDRLPTECNTVFNGAYTVSGDHTVAFGDVIFGENATFAKDGLNAKFKLSDGNVYFGNKTVQTLKLKVAMNNNKSIGKIVYLPESKVVMKDGGAGDGWVLDIFGEVDANDSVYTAFPQSVGNNPNTGTYLEPGSVMSVGYGYNQLGLNGNAPIYVYTNALLRLTSTKNENTAMGTGKGVRVIGGTVTNATEVDQMTHNLYMSNGARFLGCEASVGGCNGGYNPGMNWSKFEVGGETPSYFLTDVLRIGFKRGGWAKAGASRVVGGKFDVADVTGDEQTDFYVSSTIVDREDVTDYFDAGYRTNFGLWKTGPGTVELTGANCNAPAGVFKIEEGTVRLGKGASGKLGALMAIGDGTIDCAGGEIEFADSHEIAWADGAKLNLTGEIGRKSIRVGTDANGLTPDQLAAITVNGKKGRVAIGGDGYLIVSSGLMVIIK